MGAPARTRRGRRGARTIETVTILPADATPLEPSVAARPAAYGWRRLTVTVIIVLALMAIGLLAGRWQWGRYEARSEALNASNRAADLPTVPLESILTPADAVPGDAAWRTVTVTGEISSEDLVELRGRTIDSTASLQYLAWIHTDAGESVLINLGWTPRSQPTAPSIPEGEVTVIGTVRAFEEDNGKQGTRIVPTQMGSPSGEVPPAYVMVISACGDAGCVTGIEPVPLPQLSLGPHLSYAMQWWLLMIAAAPVAVWLTVRDASHERERATASAADDGTSPVVEPEQALPPVKASGARSAPKRRRPSDEEIEDAL